MSRVLPQRGWAAALLLAALLAPAEWVRAQPRPATTYRVIVHPAVPVAKLERRFVADAFLKKVVEWPGGTVIRPVDLTERSPVRAAFVGDNLKRSMGAVKSYWQQMIFSGRRLPPPELDSPEAVVRYVLKHPGAIGYVAHDTDVGAARTVEIE